MPNKRGQPHGPYRISQRTIRTTTRVLILIMVIGAGGGGVLMAAGEATKNDALQDWGAPFLLFGLVIPLLIAAWLGGQSLARFGGFVGLALLVGIFLAAGGWSFGEFGVLWGSLGVLLFALSVICFLWMGVRRAEYNARRLERARQDRHKGKRRRKSAQ